jgi:hypothetical protein
MLGLGLAHILSNSDQRMLEETCEYSSVIDSSFIITLKDYESFMLAYNGPHG